nr:transcription factor [Melanopsichium pennsylvanicum 4]
MEAEAKAISETKGIHSGKELPAPRMGDASETASKANTFLPGLKRAGRLNAIVDFVASASRFKLIVPRENVRLTFVLAGIRAPKTARNASEKDEPFGRDGLDFSTLRALQRDVEIEVFSTDKVGGFIGALYLNKSENLAVNLVQNGLATVHGYSAEATPFYKQLLDAEEKAKVGRLGLWHDAVAEEAEYAAAGSDGAVAPTSAGVTRGSGGAAWGATANGGGGGAAATAMAPARTEYVDCIISDVRGSSGPDDPFGFSIQILNDEIQQLETLMEEFSLHHKTPTATLTSFIPRAGDLVSAKFSQDGAWYRAIIRKVSPVLKEAQVSFIDYGNKESVKFKDLRPLDSAKFGRTRLPPQAKDARLSFVRLYDGKQAEYVEEALDRFRAIASEGSKMIANIDYVEPGTNVLHLSLYDPESPEIGKSPEQGCINYELTKEGHALLDDKVRYWKSYPRMTQALQRGIEAAKTRHRGCFEYGDPTEED